ncbi:MAG TPA: exodeoxyribonuclease VII large subunit [Burkholderiales bacterium]|nr:exodeoxyribonuclease VII large subunit [Burkholderiales bacterium]
MNRNEPRAPVITVGELNRRVRQLVEGELPLMWIAGEISSFTRAASGHCYFSLKDAQAQVRCVFFRHKAALLDFALENGMQVEVRALPTLYEARGDFQLNVETLRRAGLGLLYEAFERLKKQLDAEGLFAAERKRPIPLFPRAIGVVTSQAAAALRDVLTTLGRRMPGIPVILYPAPVQGEGSAEKIAQAIRAASARSEVDVLLVCRGGGSMEDLWAYNEEVVARAIAACAVPVVSGVGHETDFTIADFVADLRAPTPTAAAAAVTPDRSELQERLAAQRHRLARALARMLERRMQHLDYLGKRLVHPGERVARRLDQLGHLGVRMRQGWLWHVEATRHRLQNLGGALVAARPGVAGLETRRLELEARLRVSTALWFERRSQRLGALGTHLEHLNPRKVLTRGYGIVARADGSIVRDAHALSIGERIDITLARGRTRARVESKD